MGLSSKPYQAKSRTLRSVYYVGFPNSPVPSSSKQAAVRIKKKAPSRNWAPIAWEAAEEVFQYKTRISG
jgi:hypothetical protein